jgi:hypothetical protein
LISSLIINISAETTNHSLFISPVYKFVFLPLSRLLIYTILTVDKRQFRKGKYIFQLRIDKYSNYGNYNKGEGTHLCMKKNMDEGYQVMAIADITF